MDPALELRIAFDRGEIKDPGQSHAFLQNSELVRTLTAAFERKPLYAVWRILALSEIPYAHTLGYTGRVIEYIEAHLSTPAGFSLTGKEADLLPCYNAMLAEAFSKLGRAEAPATQNAVEWIRRFQPFERNAAATWSGSGVKKYGGCLKATPCYIGAAKSVKALAAYDKATGHRDGEVSSLLTKGMDYLLKHELYKRLSTGAPIHPHILDLAFPSSYQLNIVELLELAHATGTLEHPGCRSALAFIKNRKTEDGCWKTDHIYLSDGYVSFDRRGKKADWLTYFLSKYLDHPPAWEETAHSPGSQA